MDCLSRSARVLLLAFAGLVASASSARADFAIDTFTDPAVFAPYQITGLAPNTFPNPYARTDPLGNGLTRLLTVEVLAPLPPEFDSLSGGIGGGLFRFNTDSATTATASLKYTGIGSALAGTGGIDLSFLKWDSGNSATSAPVRIVVVTAAGTLTHDGAISDSGVSFIYHAPFSSFSGSGDLGNVSSLEITLNGPANHNEAVDIRMDRVTATVPAPVGVVGLLAAAPFVALARALRRRKTTCEPVVS